MNWQKVFGVVLVAVTSSVSNAAPVTFDFSDYRPYSSVGHTYTGSDDNYSVRVSPVSEYGTPFLMSSWSGLGIYTCTDNDADCYRDDNTNQIDGRGPNEAAVLDFGQEVKLLSATFSYIGSNDDFSLLINGDHVLNDVDPGNGFFSTFNFGDSIVGEQFAFLADHWSDDFKLYSVTADFVSNVPEPASLSLLGLGLMALGASRKKK